MVKNAVKELMTHRVADFIDSLGGYEVGISDFDPHTLLLHGSDAQIGLIMEYKRPLAESHDIDLRLGQLGYDVERILLDSPGVFKRPLTPAQRGSSTMSGYTPSEKDAMISLQGLEKNLLEQAKQSGLNPHLLYFNSDQLFDGGLSAYAVDPVVLDNSQLPEGHTARDAGHLAASIKYGIPIDAEDSMLSSVDLALRNKCLMQNSLERAWLKEIPLVETPSQIDFTSRGVYK